LVVTGLLGVLCLTLLALVVPSYFRANPALAAGPAVHPSAASKHAPGARHSAHHRYHAGHHYRF